MSFVESTGDGMFRVYVQLSAGRRPGTKTDEVRGIVEGIPFNVRGLTLDIDVGFSVDDYPEESEEWMEAMKPLRGWQIIQSLKPLYGLLKTIHVSASLRWTVCCCRLPWYQIGCQIRPM